MTKAEFIRKQLGRLPIVDFSNPKQAKILCPFHDDKNPSLDVALVRQVKSGGRGVAVGGFNCWSCREHGSWNKLAGKLGLEKWDEEKEDEYADHSSNDFLEFSRDLEGLSQSTQEYEKPATDGPWEGSWRGLPGSFLRSVGAESFWDKDAGEYRLFFPIKDAFGTLVGHVLARGDNSQISDKKKYLNSRGFNGRRYWFGADSLHGSSVAVIVEGPFDRLRFQQQGIPTVANLGVQLRKEDEAPVSDEKVMQLMTLGVTKVVLAFDADEAGRQVVPGFTAVFRKWGFDVFDLNLSRYLTNPEDKMDPGNCPQVVIDDLKAFLETLKK